MQYANPFKRLLAFIIDIFVVAVPAMILLYVAGFLLLSANTLLAKEVHNLPAAAAPSEELTLLANLAGTLFIVLLGAAAFLYAAVMESSRRQATVGKKLLKMKVVGRNGKRISFPRAALRFIIKAISCTVWPLLLIMFFNKKKQELYDILTGTYVINDNGGVIK